MPEKCESGLVPGASWMAARPTRVGRHFGISQPLREERTSDQIAEPRSIAIPFLLRCFINQGQIVVLPGRGFHQPGFVKIAARIRSWLILRFD